MLDNYNIGATILPSRSRKMNLREPVDFYKLLLPYTRKFWPDIAVNSDVGRAHAGYSLLSFGLSYATIMVHGIKYGASTHHHGKNLCYAYLSGRRAVRIDHILAIEITRGRELSTKTTVAVIRPFKAALDILTPWTEWYVFILSTPQARPQHTLYRSTDLGIAEWHQDELGPAMVVDVMSFSGQFALVSMDIDEIPLWITVSLDHVRYIFICLRY